MSPSPAADVRAQVEADLVAAALRLRSLTQLLVKHGARRDRARLLDLSEELQAIPEAAAKVCSGAPVTDDELKELTQRYERVTAKLFGEINPCAGKTN